MIVYTTRRKGGKHHGRWRMPIVITTYHRDDCRMLGHTTWVQAAPDEMPEWAAGQRFCKVCKPYEQSSTTLHNV